MGKKEELKDEPKTSKEDPIPRQKKIIDGLNELKAISHPEDRIFFMKFAASLFNEQEIILITSEIKFEALNRQYHGRR